MAPREMASPCQTFGPFALNPARRELLRDGVPVELGACAFDLLTCLVLHPGKIVSKQTLIDAVWNGRSIQQNNLTVQISALRRVLGVDAAGQPYIRTCNGQGYVFVPEARAGLLHSNESAQPDESFVGRKSEQLALQTLMGQRRLVTVCGLGGVGKTRLVLQVAGAAAASFTDGWRLLDLAGVAYAQGLAERLAAALGLSACTDTALLAALRARHVLLILDHVEHLPPTGFRREAQRGSMTGR